MGIKIDANLALKRLEPEDADQLFRLIDYSRTYLREWLPWVDDTKTAQDSKEYISACIRQFDENNGFTAGIRQDGRLLGVIGIHGISWRNRTASVGYWLGEPFQGRGIMTKACKGLVDYAFGVLDLHRVEIRCGTDNRKSRAIPERLGFVEEGLSRQCEWLYDHFIDHKVYSALQNEWKIREDGAR